MISLIGDQRFPHITQKIFICLDWKSLVKSCRFVSHSWKKEVDQPLLWIKKSESLIGLSKYDLDPWIELVLKMDHSLDLDVAECLIRFYRERKERKESLIKELEDLEILLFSTSAITFLDAWVKIESKIVLDTKTISHLAISAEQHNKKCELCDGPRVCIHKLNKKNFIF